MIFRATFYKTELIKKDLVTFPLPVLRDFDALLTKSRLLSVTQSYYAKRKRLIRDCMNDNHQSSLKHDVNP